MIAKKKKETKSAAVTPAPTVSSEVEPGIIPTPPVQTTPTTPMDRDEL